MVLPEPIMTVTSSVLINIASDIVESRAKNLEGTLAGRLLKWGGLIEPNFQDRLRDTVKKALQLFFQIHPEYNLVSIEQFFRDPDVAKQLGSYILDRQPIDNQKIDQALNKYIRSDPNTVMLMRQRNVSPEKIVPDFLECYREILGLQLSISEMGILLEMMDQRDEMIQEIRGSEARLKAFVEELLKTKFSSKALQTASQACQQQGVTDLATSLNTAHLAQPTEAVQTLQGRLQSLPALFTNGLCKGCIPHIDPQHYFVSHGFQSEILNDWRATLAEALKNKNSSSGPLIPYFSGDTLLGGYHFCGVCEKLYTTRFSVFLLPASHDNNVYLELGIAIGIGVPFLLIQPRGADIPPILQGLSRYVAHGAFRTIRRELPQKIGNPEEYDFGAVYVQSKQEVMLPSSRYLIVAGDLYDDEDVEGSITDAIQAQYPSLQAVTLAQQSGTNWTIERLINTIRSVRFAIYRINEPCSPTTFFALGISIALNRPFIMIQQSGSDVPDDLRGIGVYQFPNFVTLEQTLISRNQAFFDSYAQQP